MYRYINGYFNYDSLFFSSKSMFWARQCEYSAFYYVFNSTLWWEKYLLQSQKLNKICLGFEIQLNCANESKQTG